MTTVRAGLIQMNLKGDTDQSPSAIREQMLTAHLPLIDQAGAEGVQVLCMQEVCTQPYFCPSQDAKWYAAVEKIPEGPTTKLMQELAKKQRNGWFLAVALLPALVGYTPYLILTGSMAPRVPPGAVVVPGGGGVVGSRFGGDNGQG
jgi:predicted amidohydrolase